MNEILDALTRWGQEGYSINLHYGPTMRDGQWCIGWTCTIQYVPMGSAFYGSDLVPCYGYHPTDPLAAARPALRAAAERWPNVVEKIGTR